MTDKQLHQNVLDALQWDPSIREDEIGIAVKDGVVTLTGYVDSFAEKVEAERLVSRVSGVRALAEELKVKLPHSMVRSDSDIARSALTALQSNVKVPADRIKVKVENGWITLSGEVDWHYQVEAARSAVKYLPGVRGVMDMMLLQPKAPSALDIGFKIKAALRRNVDLDADRIHVATHGNTVTLSGTVRSWAERRDAEEAAWSAPGVRMVDDHIAVAG